MLYVPYKVMIEDPRVILTTDAVDGDFRNNSDLAGGRAGFQQDDCRN